MAGPGRDETGDSAVTGRQSEGRARGGAPPSFGRGEPDKPEDFSIRGGESIHLVLHVDVTPDPGSLLALHEAVAATTRAAVLDGYAAAFAEMDEPGPEPAPPAAGEAGAEGGDGDGSGTG